MRRKTVTILLLLSLTTLVAAGPPGQPADLLEQAQQLHNAGQYEQAEQLYQAVLAEQPGPDQALAAQKGLAILYVQSRQDVQAKQALEDLFADFSDHWDIARAVTHVADACRETGKHNDALETYRRVIAAWPDDEHALWSQMGIAISQACLKDAEVSDAAVDELCTNWQGQHHLGRALCIVADNWRRLNSHEKARDIYNLALASNPDPEFAMWSRMGLTISEARLGDMESAEADADRLISDFVGDSRASIAACLAADQFRAVGANAKAADLYKYVVDNWPQTEHALWSQMGLAICHIHMGDEIAAQAAVEHLISAFADKDNLGQAVEQVAREYQLLRQYDRADQLCRDAVSRQLERNLSPLGAANIARMYIFAADEEAGEAAFAEIMADYAEHKLLGEAINIVAEGYYSRAFLEEKMNWESLGLRTPPPQQEPPPRARHCFQRAVEKWSIIIEQPAATPSLTARAYCQLAECHQRLAQYDMALRYFEKVANEYPDYEDADYAHFSVGRLYETLRALGQISDRDADAKIAVVCQRLLERYPDSSWRQVTEKLLRTVTRAIAEEGETI